MTRTRRHRVRRALAATFVLAALPLVCHFAFSWIGFSPCDDGFILGPAPRVLRGEVPHRDFISIRPAGSNYLHAPIVAISRAIEDGARTLWISRGFVWFQFACIAWCWTAALDRGLGLGLSPRSRAAWATLAFFLSAHNFPIMAWHTIDGLFLIAIGARLCASRHAGARVAGMLFVGAAPLCKQNFAPVVALFALASGDARRPRTWIAAGAPGAAYAAMVLATGATDEALAQMATYTGAFDAGVGQYLRHPTFLAGLVAGLAAATFAARGTIARTAPVGPVLVVALSLGRHDAANELHRVFWVPAASGYLWGPSFLLFGGAAGWWAGRAIAILRGRNVSADAGAGCVRGGEGVGLVRAWAPALGTAWCASISIGYNTPALMNGPIALLLLGIAREHRRSEGWERARAAEAFALALLLGASLYGFVHARLRFVYEDRAAFALDRSLDGVFPGADGLRTNENTYAFLADLTDAIAIAGEREFAILPDFSAYWASARRRNPLPIDWPHGGELAANETSRARVLAALREGRAKGRVAIVQKIAPYTLAYNARPLMGGGYHKVVETVRREFRKIAETDFFEVYE